MQLMLCRQNLTEIFSRHYPRSQRLDTIVYLQIRTATRMNNQWAGPNAVLLPWPGSYSEFSSSIQISAKPNPVVRDAGQLCGDAEWPRLLFTTTVYE